MKTGEVLDYSTMSNRDFGVFIRQAFELEPQEEAEIAVAVERVRTRIHDLQLNLEVEYSRNIK